MSTKQPLVEDYNRLNYGILTQISFKLSQVALEEVILNRKVHALKLLTLFACTQRRVRAHSLSLIRTLEYATNSHPKKDHQGDQTNRSYKNAHIQFLVGRK